MQKYNTSYTLISRAKDLDDTLAWKQLTDFYKSFIYSILIKMGVHDNDLDDLCQDTLVNLSIKLKLYDAEKGKFKSWFGALIANQVKNFYRKLASETKKQTKHCLLYTSDAADD